MKRRSPWLAVAACALLNGPLLSKPACARTVERASLTLGDAASAAEAELARRGLACDHALASVTRVRHNGADYYLAQIQPPDLALRVAMDGQVTAAPGAAPSQEA